MQVIQLQTEHWDSGPVLHAQTFRERRRGLKGRPSATSMLIEAGSVHSFGLKSPFHAVGLTSELEVVEVIRVAPWRTASFAGCGYVLELPIDSPLPALGSILVWSNA